MLSPPLLLYFCFCALIAPTALDYALRPISWCTMLYACRLFVLFAQQKKTTESPADMCWAENEDYFECIHGFKEKKRMLEIIAERKRREKLGEKFEIS